MRASLPLAALLCLISRCLPAAEAPLIPRRLLFADEQHYNPRLSPDGRRLAYQAPHQGRVNLWVRDLATGQDRAVTSYKDHSVRFFGWFYDSATLYFYRDKGGNEEYKFYTVSASGGEPRRLIPNNDIGAPPLFLHPSSLTKALLGVQGFIFSLDTTSGKLRPVEKFPHSYFWVDAAFEPRIALERTGSLLLRGADGDWHDLFKVGKLDEIGRAHV